MSYNPEKMYGQADQKSKAHFLALAYLPVFVLIICLKLQRGIALGSVDSFFSALTYVLVELSLCTLLTVSFFVITRQLRRGFLFGFSVIAIYLLTTCVASFELATYELFEQTGLILNWPLLLFGFERFEMVIKAVDQQVSSTTIIYFAGALTYLTVIHVLIFRFTADSKVKLLRVTSLWVLAASILVYASLLYFSTGFGFPREEFRGATSHLVLSYFEFENSKRPQQIFEPADEPFAPANFAINDKLNVVIVILESTRQWSVSPYSGTNVTPYFAKLAETSLLAENAYSTSPHTSRAVYSILCGRFPRAGNAIVETLKNGITQACLPHLLAQQGYQTAFFQSATEDFENRAQLVKNMGFSEFFPLEKFDTTDFEKSNYFGYEDNIMLPASRKWLTSHAEPFQATYLTVTPHFHYDAIKRYGWKIYTQDKKTNAYLNTLHYQDNFLRNLVQQYKNLGLYENTLFVVLGDHGEAFREHRMWGHGNIVYEEGVKVPFLIHHAGQFTGRVQPRVSLLDVVPSILGQLDFDGPDDFYPGQDIQLPLKQRDILLECISPNQCTGLIDAETGLKLIYYYQRRPDELYDIETDPKELDNLLGDLRYQEVYKNLKTRLLDKIDKVRATGPDSTYDSWAFRKKPVTWLDHLPGVDTSFQNEHSIENKKGDRPVLLITSSKEHVYAGDSFNLGYILGAPEADICVESTFEGVKRHPHREYEVTGNESGAAYFQIMENLQVQPNASEIRIDIVSRSDCSRSAGILTQDQVVIELLKHNDQLVFSEKLNQVIQRQQVPSQTDVIQGTKYIEELLNPDLPADKFSTHCRPAMRSESFVNEIRKTIAGTRNQYGDFKSSRLESAWESKDGGSASILRYQVFFSKESSMDFRVIFEDSEIVALYFYYPWKAHRPL